MFENKDIRNILIIIFLFAIAMVAIMTYELGRESINNPPISSAVPVFVDTPMISPTTTPTTGDIVYMVDSMDINNYEVTTKEGTKLYFPNYASWSNQVKNCIYTATIIESQWDGFAVKGHATIDAAYIPPNGHRQYGKYVESE